MHSGRLEEAIRGLEAFYQQFPTDGGHLGGLFYDLGTVEQIFRDQDQYDEFHQRIDHLREILYKAGYQTEAIWYLGGRIDLPEITPIDQLEDWTRTPGHDLAHIHNQQNTLLFYTHPTQSFGDLTISRVHRQVTGDFILQATIHASSQVLESLLRCRDQKTQGQITPLASGGGGLYVFHDKFNYLHLGVHRYEPGQILFEQIDGRNAKHLGRGLLNDGPIRLRLERRGTTLFAYANNEDRDWYACGQVDLPGWDTVEISLYGGNVDGLHQGMVKKLETRFWDIALELKNPQPIQPVLTPTTDPLYPLPEPAYAPDLSHFVAADPAMLRLLKRIPQIGRTHLPVLIQGETGTGKELIARAVHQLGDRATGPFVPINCATLTPELIDSLLFGHVRGAYTGAYDTRGGLFEAADQGILFLDEIGDASPELQTHLLRVIEEQAVRRLGESQLRRVDVRLVTATNRDLPAALADGTFRQDFYFRLRGMELHLPPLREHRDDIPYLVSHALRQWSQRRENPLPEITCKAMEFLQTHDWPGNVRELLHTVERAAEEADGDPINPAHLGIQPPRASTPCPSPSSQQEYQRIIAALQATDGNVAAAARRLGIGRSTLYRRMRRLAIPYK